MERAFVSWVEAYSKWPPQSQMTFSACGMVLAALLLFLAGLGLLHVGRLAVAAFRGWPDDGRPTWADITELEKALKAYKLAAKAPPKPAPTEAATNEHPGRE